MSIRMRFLLLAVVALCCVAPRFAHAEVIHALTEDVTVASDGTLTVVENIRYDFEGDERHGMYRIIPYSYKRDAFTYNTRIHIQSVASGNGNPIPYTESRSGGSITVQIGDPDILVSGEQEYVLTYTVARAINWFDGEPEVYWNVVGTNWDVAVEHARGTFTGLGGYDSEKASCYTGVYGIQESNCTVQTDSAGENLTVFATDTLYPNEGLSVAIRLPAGSIPEPTAWERAGAFFADNWPLGLPVFVFFLLWWLYRRFGKDPAGRGTIIAEYEPPHGMSPAMVGYLIDERIDPRDISAGIIGLAVKGTLQIVYEKKKGLLKFGHTYRLKKKAEPGSACTQFEKELHEALFASKDSVTLNSLKKTFPQKLGKLKKTLQKEADDAQYFVRNPAHVAGAYYGAGALLGVIAFFSFGASLALFIGCVLSAGLFFAFATAMPQKTEQGVLAREHILGFKDFLTVTEKDRLKFHNAPAKKPEQFMEFLPYAMALSVEQEWAQQFKGITIEQPDWYTGQDWSTFNTLVFVHAMSDFGTSAKSQAFTAPNSGGGGGSSGFGGGGFSGGGFGGGGGGSW